MTEYINITHRPGQDGVMVGLPGNQGMLYRWMRVLAGGTSEFSEVRMRGPIYDKNGLEILSGSGGFAPQIAIVDPTPADDSSLGFTAGDGWLNTVTGQYWKAQSVALGAAEWSRDSGQYFGSNYYMVGSMGLALPASTTDSVVLGNYIAYGPNNINCVAIGSVDQGNNHDRSVLIGGDAIGSSTSGGSDVVCIGGGIANSSSVAIKGQASSQQSVAIGVGSLAADNETIAVGAGSDCQGGFGLVIGNNSIASGGTFDIIVIGANSHADFDANIIIGEGVNINTTPAVNSIGIGHNIDINQTDCVGIGANITITGEDSVLIGTGNSSSARSIAIGHDSDANQIDSICIGANADTTAGQPRFSLAFGGVNPVVAGNLDRLPTRITGTNRAICMRDTDLALDDLSDVATTGAVNTNGLFYDSTNWVNAPARNRYYALWRAPANIVSSLPAGNYTHWVLFSSPFPTYTASSVKVWGTGGGTTVNVAIYEGPTIAVGRNRLTQATALGTLVANDAITVPITPLVITRFTMYSIGFSTNGIGLAEGPGGIATGTTYGAFNSTLYGLGAMPATIPVGTTNSNRRQYFELLP